ncbi:MAG: MFS transporter [Chloroflexota bacterium]|nr:MFS transporter [Chloroflexota bacterium]
MINASFRRLLAAAALSDSANGVFSVAAAIIAAQVSRSPLVVGAVTVAATLPWLVLAIPAGMLADSFDRARAITYANVGRGLLMLLLAALLALGAPAAPALIVVVFAVAALQTVVDTAAEALIPELVPAGELTRANGALAVSTRITYQFAGPLLAGILVAVTTQLPALVAGLTCLLAAFLLAKLPRRHTRLPALAPAAGTSAVARPARLRIGLVTIAGSPVLATVVAVGAVTTLANGAFLTVFVLYAIAPGPLGLDPAAYGLLIGMIGVGAAVGSLLTARFEALVGREHVLWLTRVGWATVFAAPLALRGIWLAAVMAAGSAFGGMYAVQAMSIRQRTSAPRERG